MNNKITQQQILSRLEKDTSEERELFGTISNVFIPCFHVYTGEVGVIKLSTPEKYKVQWHLYHDNPHPRSDYWVDRDVVEIITQF